MLEINNISNCTAYIEIVIEILFTFVSNLRVYVNKGQ